MSDLRKRLEAEAYKAELPLIERAWPIIEAELQQLRNIADDKEKQRWEDANDYAILKQRVYKLLEQTIEVLGDLDMRLKTWPSLYSRDAKLWFALKAKPLLDKLQALKKEGTG